MVDTALKLFMLVATIGLGLAIRKFGHALPLPVYEKLPDALWGLMVFLIVTLLLPRLPIRRAAGCAVLFAVVIEIFKLYDPMWLHRIRYTTLGGLVLGHVFAPEKIVSYIAGIVLGGIVLSRYQRNQGAKIAHE